MDAPNQEAIRSTDARPGTWNSGRTTGFAITPRNSMIPQSVRNGMIKLNEWHSKYFPRVSPIPARRYRSGAMLDVSELRQGHLDTYAYFFTKVINRPEDFYFHTKPAGTYAVAYLKGDYYDSEETYRKLFQ